MVLEIDVKLDLDNSNDFQKKGLAMYSQVQKFLRRAALMAQREIQNKAPRKTGKLKGAVQFRGSGYGRVVFVDEKRAPYADAVIDGREPVKPVNKKALRFKINGQWVFAKSVKGTKANPFVDNAYPVIDSKMNAYIRELEEWLVQ